MNLRQAKSLLKHLYRMQIDTGERYTVELVSGPGIGKSEMVKQFCVEMGKELGKPFACKPLFLTTIEQPDVRGFVFPAKTASGKPVAAFTDAVWVPQPGEPDAGVLFLDELGQADHDVVKPAAELLLNGAVGDSRLPITYMVIGASNRTSDRSGVQRALAFIENRRILIEITAELDPWVEWAESKGVAWQAIAFAKHSPSDIFSDTVPDKPGPFPTPRSFYKASTMVTHGLPSELLPEALAGLLGAGTAAKFQAFIRLVDELPTFEQIAKDPKGTPVPDVKRPDLLYSVTQMVSSLVTKDSAAASLTYLRRLPPEFQLSGVIAAIRREPRIANVREFGEWIVQNHKLAAAVGFSS